MESIRRRKMNKPEWEKTTKTKKVLTSAKFQKILFFKITLLIMYNFGPNFMLIPFTKLWSYLKNKFCWRRHFLVFVVFSHSGLFIFRRLMLSIMVILMFFGHAITYRSLNDVIFIVLCVREGRGCQIFEIFCVRTIWTTPWKDRRFASTSPDLSRILVLVIEGRGSPYSLSIWI